MYQTIATVTSSLMLAFTCLWNVPFTSAQPAEARDWPVFVEDSPSQQEMMEQASGLVLQKRLTEAAALYQQISDQYGLKLTRTADTLYVSAGLAVQQELIANPALLQAYQQLFSAQAQRLLDESHSDVAGNHARVAAELASVMDRFYLTPAGLDAALELASRRLEAARPTDAINMLRRLANHPDLQSREVQWRGLLAAAAVFGGDPQTLVTERQQLVNLGQQASSWVTRIDQWRQLLLLPDAPPGQMTPAGQNAVKLPLTYRSPLWRVKLGDDADAAGQSDDENGNGLNQGAANVRSARGSDKAAARVMMPLEREGVLYLNETQGVMALDIHSGRVLWRVNTDVFDELTSRQLPFRLFYGDMRGVAVDGDQVAAVVGRLASMPGRMGGMAKPTRLIVLDASNGSIRYSIDSSLLPDPIDELNFHGTPIAADGRVYVLGRRSRTTGFHTEYLFAFDASTGVQLWRRHLASANALANRRAISPMGQMLLHNDRLYIVDNLGAVSCVDVMSGTIIWLAHGKNIPSAIDSAMGRVATPSLLMGSPPIMVEEGLLVPPASPGQTAALLDPATGLIVRELDKNLWSQGEYLVKVDGDVYSIGYHVQRFDGRSLLRKWGVKLDGGSKINMQGIAAFTKEHLLLPVNNRLVVLNRQTGNMTMQPELSINGSLVALDSQVVVTSANEVGGFMSWDDAYARLMQQIAAAPQDPTPAMALAHLAGESGQPSAMLKAVDMAIAAVSRLPMPTGPADIQNPRRKMFEQIIELARETGDKNALSRRGLYDRLAVVTSDLGDEVTYHLIFGDFLIEMKDYHQAADQFQYILNDESLSEQLYTRDNLARQSGLEARVRLTKLIEKYGLDTYRSHEMVAASRLVTLTAPGVQTDPQALIQLAKQYPVSRSAGQALLAAADRLIQLGRPADAARQLRGAYELATEASVLQRVIGKLVELHLAQGQPRQARTWLLIASRRGISPLQSGRPVRAQVWLSQVEGIGSENIKLPGLTLPLGQPRLIEAKLLTPREQPQSTWPVNLMMTSTAGKVQLRAAPSWEVAWESPVPEGEGDVELLWLTQDRALLWLPQTQQLASLDVATGNALWEPIDIKAALEQLGGVEQKWDARSAPRRQFEGWMDAGGVVFRNGRLEVAGTRPRQGVMIAVNEMTICVVDGIGRATGIDRQTGRLLWRRILPVDQISLLQMDDQTLAAGGVNGVRVGAEGGALILIDPMTGEPLLESAIENKRPLNWLGLSGVNSQGEQVEGGMVFFCTGQELVAHRVRDGQLMWRLPVEDKNFSGTASLVDGSLLMQDTEGATWIIDTQNGKVRSRVNFPIVHNMATWIQPAQDAWHIATQSQAARLTELGQVQWRDGLGQLPGQVIIAQWVSEPFVGLLAVDGVNPFEQALPPGAQRLIQPMPGVRIQIRNQQLIQNRAQQQKQVIKPVQPQQPEAPVAPDGRYHLILLDRTTGSVMLRQTLQFDGRPLKLSQAVMLDETMVVGDASVTILIPSAAAVARPDPQ